MKAVEDGQMDILDMWQEGYGQQDVRFFKRRVAVVLLELNGSKAARLCASSTSTPHLSNEGFQSVPYTLSSYMM